MFGSMDLEAVLRHQEALRDDAARRRMAARINHNAKRKDQARRVLGLRLSLA